MKRPISKVSDYFLLLCDQEEKLNFIGSDYDCTGVPFIKKRHINMNQRASV